MCNSLSRWSILILALLLPFFSASAAESYQPLRDSEVIALVAGAALPANIVHEIAARGLDFNPDEPFRSQLKSIGADTTILSALKTAKRSPTGTQGEKSHQVFLAHLNAAARLINTQDYDAATVELNAAIDCGSDSPSVGFIVGELLRAEERYSEAVAVYAEIIKQNPSFPEAHTKLSYVLYRTGESDDALHEAKLAIAQNRNSAEAHKNTGLAFDSLRKFAAAATEYQEALRLKPDYAIVHYDLGLLFYNKRDFPSSIAAYQKSIALDPTCAQCHESLGLALKESGDLNSAIQELREAKRLDPKRDPTNQAAQLERLAQSIQSQSAQAQTNPN
jgi:tetratricopeptide (TPR) repeat protein